MSNYFHCFTSSLAVSLSDQSCMHLCVWSAFIEKNLSSKSQLNVLVCQPEVIKAFYILWCLVLEEIFFSQETLVLSHLTLRILANMITSTMDYFSGWSNLDYAKCQHIRNETWVVFLHILISFQHNVPFTANGQTFLIGKIRSLNWCKNGIQQKEWDYYYCSY